MSNLCVKFFAKFDGSSHHGAAKGWWRIKMQRHVLLVATLLWGGPGLAESIQDIAEYSGTAQCSFGQLSVRVTSEPGGARLEFSSGPGQLPWALGHSYVPNNVSFKAGSSPIQIGVQIGSWAFRPTDVDRKIGPHQYMVMEPVAGSENYSLKGIEACGPIELRNVPLSEATGGAAGLDALPRRWEGTLGCYPLKQGQSGPNHTGLMLDLVPTSEREFEGTLELKVKQDPDTKIVQGVFGEYNPETGALVVIGDHWQEKSRFVNDVVSFETRVVDGGRRMVGSTSQANCGAVLMTSATSAPDRGYFNRANPELSLLEWDTPAACVTFIDWANQALEETGERSLYQMQLGISGPISTGLFADSRFVPFFGKPFLDLSPEERAQVIALRESCRFQYDYSVQLHESFAYTAIGAFFPDRMSERWLELKRYALMQRRLVREVDELDARTVGPDDVAGLTSTREELAGRYPGIWKSDLSIADGLMSAKLDQAYGKLATRLLSEIDALPNDLSAFSASSSIERDIATMSGEGADDKAALETALAAKLIGAADAAAGQIGADLASRQADLGTLERLSRNVNALSQIVAQRLPSGPGYAVLRAEAGRIADGAEAAFGEQAARMIDEAAGFEERETQYSALLHFASRTIPASMLVSDLFQSYHRQLQALEPAPRETDLVQPDGAPTNFGLKLAVANYVSSYYSDLQTWLPFDMTALFTAVRVSDVQKTGCSPSEAGGYWCQMQVKLDSSLPLPRQFSDLPSELRLTFNGGRWQVVEVPSSNRPPPQSYVQSEYERRESQALSEDYYRWAEFGMMQAK